MLNLKIMIKEYKEGLESNPNLFNEINDEPPTVYNPASFK